jgi:hypothetical protein
LEVWTASGERLDVHDGLLKLRSAWTGRDYPSVNYLVVPSSGGAAKCSKGSLGEGRSREHVQLFSQPPG